MIKKLWAYIQVCKIRETILLTFIGLGSCVIGAKGHPDWGKALFATLAVMIASAGANGMTNYLDRNLDAKMPRTQKRVFPQKKIDPPEKALPWLIFLIALGLLFSYMIHPVAFFADLIGNISAFIYRKKNTCVFPQGAIASVAPIIIGWYGDASYELTLVIVCLMICCWLPLHVWTVMISHRDEYLNAGVDFFPLKAQTKTAIYILFVCAVALIGLGIWFFFETKAGLIYAISVGILDLLMLYSCVNLYLHYSDKSAWKLYKLSSFPYLGMLFLFTCIDLWAHIGIIG